MVDTCRTFTIPSLTSTVTTPSGGDDYWGDSYWGEYYWALSYWGSAHTIIWGVPNERTLAISAETRALTVPAETRTLTMDC